MPTPKSANCQKNHDHSRSTKKHTSGAGISGAEIWSTPPYPVSPSERERLPPLPGYVRAEPTYVGWRNFCRLGNGIPPREGRQNVWGEAEQGYIQPKDAISVEHGHGVLGREGLATAEENYRRINARSSKFIVTMKNATEKAILRGERVAALKAGEKKVSPADRSTLLGRPHQTLDETADPVILKAYRSVEICHPKPQTFSNLGSSTEFDPRTFVASSYITCVGAESVSGWLGNDEVANRRFEAYEARRG